VKVQLDLPLAEFLGSNDVFSCDTLLTAKGAARPQGTRFMREKVPKTEQTSSSTNPMLEHFQTHRQILFDITANYLEPLDGAFQRLAYLFSLRESSSGRYVHERLAAEYGLQPVDQLLTHCHEEVFERLLEMPLNSQGDDLRRYLTSLPGSFVENAQRCRETAKNWIPQQAPSYLKELFCSNLNALLEMLLSQKTTARSGK
jgi:hypothetical protein